MAGGNSIKLFSFNRNHYYVIGVYPEQWDQNRPSLNLITWFHIISYVLFSVPSIAFFLLEAKTMLEFGISFYAGSVAPSLTSAYLAMVWQMENTVRFIESCERFIEKRKSSADTYRELNHKIERLCEFLGIAMFTTVEFMYIPFLLYSMVNYYILDLGVDSFDLLFLAKWPFSWRTPLGYIVAWSIQHVSTVTIVFVLVIFLNSILGSCWLFIVMAEDIAGDLTSLNKNINSNKNRVDWKKGLCDVVQLYSDAKQCVSEFNTTLRYSLFSLISFLMVSVSSLLVTLQFQLLDEDTKFVDIFVVVMIAFWINGLIFFICELGERMTHHFDRFHQELERCDWHKLPIELQRMYLIFLADTQQPKNIACYANILCTREAFKRITNNGFSYFMTLRRFDAH